MENTDLQQEQESAIQKCKDVLDGILGVNDGLYASLVLFPLRDPVIRQKIYEHYSYNGYKVNFALASMTSGLRWIDLHKRSGGLVKPIPVEQKTENISGTKAMGVHA